MEGWKPTQILWAEQPLDTSTGAVRVETDCGSGYAKLLGNPEGPHVLACEVVGTRAANWLGLPTAEFAVVNVDQAHLVEFKDGTRSEAGPAFCSRLHRGATWGGTAEELEIVENPEAISGLVVLDTWLRNCDRYLPPRFNFRNVFFSEEGAHPLFHLRPSSHTQDCQHRHGAGPQNLWPIPGIPTIHHL